MIIFVQTEDIKLTKGLSGQEASTNEENEEDAFKEEKDDVFIQDTLADKSKKTLAYKRSFFVRMVSDPKLYNPKIVPTKSIDVGAGDEVGRRSSDSLDEQQARCSTSTNAHQNINIEAVKIYDNFGSAQQHSPTM